MEAPGTALQLSLTDWSDAVGVKETWFEGSDWTADAPDPVTAVITY